MMMDDGVMYFVLVGDATYATIPRCMTESILWLVCDGPGALAKCEKSASLGAASVGT